MSAMSEFATVLICLGLSVSLSGLGGEVEKRRRPLLTMELRWTKRIGDWDGEGSERKALIELRLV